MTARPTMSPLFTWRSAILASDLPPTARHLALTLSTYMNEAGGSAYPGADRLVRDTGLTKVSIMKWRKALADLGWLVLTKQGGSSAEGGRVANEYAAQIPDNYARSWADAPAEFRDKKLGRKPPTTDDDPVTTLTGQPPEPPPLPGHDRSTSLTGQADTPVNHDAPTGQPPIPVPVNDVCATGQRPVPQSVIESAIQSATTLPVGQRSPKSAPAALPAEGPEPLVARGKPDGKFELIARGFGYNPAGLPEELRKRIRSALTRCDAAGLPPDRLPAAVWLFRSRNGIDVASFGMSAATLSLDKELALHAYRDEAAAIVAAACAEEGLGPAGRCRTEEEAEHVVAKLLHQRHPPERIAAALVASPGWSHGQLTTAMALADRAGLRAVPAPPLSLDDARAMTFELVVSKLQDRRTSPENREALHDEVRRRVAASGGESSGSPPLTEREARLFLSSPWQVHETASVMHGIVEDLQARRSGRADAPDPTEAAFRAAVGAPPSTPRALTEGTAT